MEFKDFINNCNIKISIVFEFEINITLILNGISY